MAFNPADASAAISAGRLPETVRTFVLEDGTIGNTHFVAIPFNAAHAAGAMVVADFLLSPEAQARKQDPRVWGDGTVLDLAALAPEDRAPLRAPAARDRDPAAGPADAGAARAASVMDGRDRGGVAAPVQQLIATSLLRYLPALTVALFLGPVVAGPARDAAAGVRLSAGARRRGALARALAAAARRARPVPRRCGRADQRLSPRPRSRSRWPPDLRGRPRHRARSARIKRAHGAAAGGAASRDRGRPRLPDRALGLAGAAGLALAERVGARRRTSPWSRTRSASRSPSAWC